MSELLSAAAAALGLPEPLVQRSAAARAAETGASVDDVLSAWAEGGDVPSSAAAPADEPEDEAEPKEAEAEPEEEAKPKEPEPEPVGARPVADSATRAAAASPTPPSEVTRRQAAHLPEVVTVPTAGIRERTSATIPRWLNALLVAVPLVALLALGDAATGQCGSGTELTVDVVTGEIVDCDGSQFTGRDPGGVNGQDFVALGQQVYSGAAVTGVNCAGCHGAGGEGIGAFPPMTGVITTFGACTDHLEWVSLGSIGFTSAGRGTYGDTGKTVGGGMPGFGNLLTEEQLAAVAAYERVRYAGGEPETVLVDCGLVEPEDEGADEDGDAEAEAGAPGRSS